MDDTYDLLDIKQAAKFLNVSETSLRRWTNSGQLACLRIGTKRERRFRRSDLHAFLEIQSPTSSKETHSPQHTMIGGIPVIYGSHFCSLYSSNSGRTKLAVDFLLDGLHQSQGCVCHLMATPEAIHEVLDRLKLSHPNYQKDIDSGRLFFSEYMHDTRQQLEQLEISFNNHLRNGARSIRHVGNISDGRIFKEKTMSEVIQYELEYGRVLSKRFPLVTLCQYNVHQHSGHDIQSILKCHQNIFQYPPDRLLF